MAIEKEKVKRLQPLPETLRRLFLTSGNVCAFPNCKELMIDLDGNFVGQLCHIEAAEPGGERFNPSMTNEERRAFDNLMLMCYRHHTITHDVKQYSVRKMKEMKANHEAMFSDPALTMARVLEDETVKTESRKASSLKRINEVLDWNFDDDDDELKETAKYFNDLAKRLRELPKNARTLVRIIVERAGSVGKRERWPELPFVEIAQSCNVDQVELWQLIQVLDRHNFVQAWDREEPSQTIGLTGPFNSDYEGIWFDY